MKETDHFYLKQLEPERSTFLALKEIIISMDADISNSLKYGMPFFTYKGKMFCYLWKDKANNQPYIGFVEGNRMNHSALIKGNRSRMKILTVNPNKDLPFELIKQLLNEALDLYRNGIIKTKQK
jgi:hypothetical protein